jgi:Flp pilus assembly protein TadG
MKHVRLLLGDRRGSAAVEMVLVTPILLMLMFGGAELGNYFMNEHSLVKAVRDGARYAARQSFANYTSCSGQPGGTVVDDTKNVVMYGYRAAGTGVLTPNITADDITVETSCDPGVVGGIYSARADGAQVVTVSATVDYLSVWGAFGFSGASKQLNASAQAAVTGI